MTNSEFIRQLNADLPPSIQTLGGEVLAFDQVTSSATVGYQPDEMLCNADGGIQGGFVCGMLDAAMAIAVFCHLRELAIVATLEIKVSYLEVTRPGKLSANGTVVRSGKTVTFLEAELRSEDEKILARATSTARVIRKK